MTPEARTEQALTGLNPAFADLVRRVLAEMARIGRPMVAYDGLRTTAQQQALYAKGRTTGGKIVTYADGVRKRSRHQDGVAVDCAFLLRQPTLKRAWTLTWGGSWDDYGALAESAGLVWGGRWAMRDYPHIERQG